MPFILHIETATTVCSVAVSLNRELLALKETNTGYTHAENLHVFIQEVLKEASVKPSQLSAIVVSKGPGSYTGLRIGVSAAKGLAYALSVPLISVDTLQSMAYHVSLKTPGLTYVPMLDARRMEVYCGVYNRALQLLEPVNAHILGGSSASVFAPYSPLCFFGDGMPKAKALLSHIPGAVFSENVFPSAADMISLAFEKYEKQAFEDVAYFEPFYLKEFMLGAR
ncbi:MAG: tRNA (adenosine(37)-N6)-threonylcarbamoyltransferase complex dimerization subunit type 1 TsaB [Bacteroidetes bacterium]|nr:tRNA (adenosine(37)-N6)-threonylcarbamoyltransferase complex dimerization subunit type 1 TsaB [Bacteroidota bacterium]